MATNSSLKYFREIIRSKMDDVVWPHKHENVLFNDGNDENDWNEMVMAYFHFSTVIKFGSGKACLSGFWHITRATNYVTFQMYIHNNNIKPKSYIITSFTCVSFTVPSTINICFEEIVFTNNNALSECLYVHHIHVIFVGPLAWRSKDNRVEYVSNNYHH